MIWLGRTRILILHKGSLPTSTHFCQICILLYCSQSFLHPEEIPSIYINIYLQDQVLEDQMPAARQTKELSKETTGRVNALYGSQVASLLRPNVYFLSTWMPICRRYFKATSKLGLRKAFGKAFLSIQLQNAWHKPACGQPRDLRHNWSGLIGKGTDDFTGSWQKSWRASCALPSHEALTVKQQHFSHTHTHTRLKAFASHTHFRSSKVIVPRGSASMLFPQNFNLG